MTGLIILTFIPLFAAVFFLIRTREEQKLRRETERQLQQRMAGNDSGLAEWNAVLGHELRSPIAAILGYQELIEEGTFGDMPEAARDSLHRIALAARQLLVLVEAVERSGQFAGSVEQPADVPAADLCRSAIDQVRFDAEARGAAIVCDPTDLVIRTCPEDACRALVLILGAAVKVSPGASLRLSVSGGAVPRITVAGARLEPHRDSAAPGVPLTGAALRLELARATARLAGAAVELDADGSVHLDLPPRAPRGD